MASNPALQKTPGGAQTRRQVSSDHEGFLRYRRFPRLKIAALHCGTPDYATRGWRIIQPIYGHLIPGGYRDEHITHYPREGLSRILSRHGFAFEATDYVAGSELIMRWRKPAGAMITESVSAPTAAALLAPRGLAL